MNTVLLSDWLEIAESRITCAEQYNWNCYGDNAFSITFWNQIHGVDERATTVVFDLRTQEVYEAIVFTGQCGNDSGSGYRWFNENYRQAYFSECTQRDIDDEEFITYTDLEVWEDFAEKCHAILNNYEYDTRVKIPLNFSDEELLQLFKLAHEEDVTFNDFIENGLRETINSMLNDKENLNDIWPKKFL